MKIRIGFISNSSSSSFILDIRSSKNKNLYDTMICEKEFWSTGRDTKALTGNEFRKFIDECYEEIRDLLKVLKLTPETAAFVIVNDEGDGGNLFFNGINVLEDRHFNENNMPSYKEFKTMIPEIVKNFNRKLDNIKDSVAQNRKWSLETTKIPLEYRVEAYLKSYYYDEYYFMIETVLWRLEKNPYEYYNKCRKSIELNAQFYQVAIKLGDYH